MGAKNRLHYSGITQTNPRSSEQELQRQLLFKIIQPAFTVEQKLCAPQISLQWRKEKCPFVVLSCGFSLADESYLWINSALDDSVEKAELDAFKAILPIEVH